MAVPVGRLQPETQPYRCILHKLVVLTCMLARRGNLVAESCISCAPVGCTIFSVKLFNGPFRGDLT